MVRYDLPIQCDRVMRIELNVRKINTDTWMWFVSDKECIER